MSQQPESTSRPVEAKSAKLVLLGESGVGKSSIALRFARNEFFSNQETTIGATFLTRTVRLPTAGSAALKYEIWDTAGQERYRSLAPIYYRGACGALVVYDVTHKESFKRAQNWIRELRTNADPSLTIFLVGNKLDMEPSLRQVTTEEGEALAATEEVAGFYEASAKEGTNIEQIFMDLAGKLLERGAISGRPAGGVRNLEEATPNQQPQTNCC